MLLEPGCGNPLFLKWIREWHEQVQGVNKNYAYTLKKAMDALSKYPLPLEAKDTIQLNGIGPKIAAKLEQKWQEHLKANPPKSTQPELLSANNENLEIVDFTPPDILTEESTLPKPKNKRATRIQNKNDPVPKRKKEYVPQHRTGAFAILLALKELHSENQYSSSFQKEDLMEAAQKHCDVPMDKPLPGKMYSGWSAIKTLVQKELVYTVGRPAKYALSDTGKDLSERLSQVNSTIISNEVSRPCTPQERIPTMTQNAATRMTPVVLPILDILPDQLFRLLPGDYEIVLVLDNREVRGKKDRDYFQNQLEKKGITTITRALSLGDALWIARPFVSGGPHEEIVLDFIVERKNMDDLSHSIKDGRFKEQKFRLKNCGAKKVIYLVEGFNIKESANFALQPQAFWTCFAQTLVTEGFSLKMTSTMEDTLDYLARLTHQIRSIYEGRAIEGLQDENISRGQFLQLQDSGRLPRDTGLTLATFLHVNDKSKHLTLTDVFLKMLMTCKGLSLSKASQILKKYPTPSSLVDAFLDISPNERESLLAISNPIQSRNISRPLAKKLYNIWRPN